MPTLGRASDAWDPNSLCLGSSWVSLGKPLILLPSGHAGTMILFINLWLFLPHLFLELETRKIAWWDCVRGWWHYELCSNVCSLLCRPANLFPNCRLRHSLTRGAWSLSRHLANALDMTPWLEVSKPLQTTKKRNGVSQPWLMHSASTCHLLSLNWLHVEDLAPVF